MRTVQQNKQKTLTGVVRSVSGKKSIRVEIQYRIRHPKYNKYIRRRTKLSVHDELELAGVGDTVEIAECRPMSKTKSWRVVKVAQKAVAV
ncbi:MAG TPA: 30S ribosomal protein S17 [Phycisphaerales bacterium]|nr:30S ribosomal protein S17 [Phycisphaerales bacterium]